MTTLTTLKARIAADLERSDLTTEIGQAIEDAIRHHQTERFWFNETRDLTFTTVAGQSIYTADDDADIGNIIRVDAAFVSNGGSVSLLTRETPERIEYLTDNSAASGEPYLWTWFAGAIRLYGIPNDAYDIQLIGHFAAPAPASDAETGNAWMVNAFELIRCTAKGYLAVHVTRDPQLAGDMVQAEARELDRLRRATSRYVASNTIRATPF